MTSTPDADFGDSNARPAAGGRAAYRAVVLDLDGTLVPDNQIIRPRSLEVLRELHRRGVIVMVATGRSEASAAPVVDDLPGDAPAIVYNGAAAWDPVERTLIEERLIDQAQVGITLDFAESRSLLPIIMQHGRKVATDARDEYEDFALRTLVNLETKPDIAALRAEEHAIRVSLMALDYPTAAAFEADFRAFTSEPFYLTSFALDLLPEHRSNPLKILDIQPHCRGKSEALRLLEERYGIGAHEVIAFGDATNDLPILRDAGLGVVMSTALDEVKRTADRVIGPADSDAIATLLVELFDLD